MRKTGILCMALTARALSIALALLLPACGGDVNHGSDHDKLTPDRELFGQLMASSDVRGFEVEPRPFKGAAARGLEAFEIVHGSKQPLRGGGYREFLFPLDTWRPLADPDEACRIETVVRFRTDSTVVDLLSSPTCGRLFLVSQGRCIGVSDSESSAAQLTALHTQVTVVDMETVVP